MILFINNKAVTLSISDSIKYHFGSLCQRLCNSGKNDASALALCLPLWKSNACEDRGLFN